MDVLPALDLWDVAIEVLRSTNSTKTPIHQASGNRCETGNCSRGTTKPKQKGNRDVDQLSHVDHVTTNAHFSQGESQLQIFEDNEAVIKMNIEGRSPTMRHVSRTHRVALDGLFDRINLDPKIQIKHVDTKNQLVRHSDKGQYHTWWMESICCVCSISAISVLQFVLMQWQKDYNKILVQKSSLERRKERWDLLMNKRDVQFKHLTNFRTQSKSMERLMIRIMLILFPQTSNLRHQRSFVVCVWRQRSSDQDDTSSEWSPTSTCFSEPTELR